MNGTITTKPTERQAETLARFGVSPTEIEQLDKKTASNRIKELVEESRRARGTQIEPGELLNQKQLGEVEKRTARRLETAKQIVGYEYDVEPEQAVAVSPLLVEVFRQLGEEELVLVRDSLIKKGRKASERRKEGQ